MELMNMGQSCWAQLAPDLLRAVMGRIETVETCWPARRDVVSCACVCNNWRAIVKEVMRVPESSGQLTFPISLKQSGPREGTLKCFIKRSRATQTYCLYLEVGEALASDGKFLLAARKCKNLTCTDYLISLHRSDISKRSSTYIGKLRSNFLGTKFTIYDAHPAYDVTKSRSGSSPRVPAIDYPVSHISYDLNVLGSRGPRTMNCVMDSIPASAVKEGGKAPMQTDFPVTSNDSFSSIPFFRSRAARIGNPISISAAEQEERLVLKNKSPRSHTQQRRWCLDFQGRVTVGSIENFQLVVSGENGPGNNQENDKVIIQFGKTAKDVFTMDYCYPVSAFQSFAICLSSIVTKIACD